jgi:hypothetical protein
MKAWRSEVLRLCGNVEYYYVALGRERRRDDIGELYDTHMKVLITRCMHVEEAQV